MAWLAVDKDGTEYIYDDKPYRKVVVWDVCDWDYSCVKLPVGSVKKLIGRELTWEDEPVEIE